MERVFVEQILVLLTFICVTTIVIALTVRTIKNKNSKKPKK